MVKTKNVLKGAEKKRRCKSKLVFNLFQSSVLFLVVLVVKQSNPQLLLLACIVSLVSKDGIRAVNCLSRRTVVVHDKCQRTQQVNLPVCVQNQSSY